MNEASPNKQPAPSAASRAARRMWDWPDLTEKIFQRDKSLQVPDLCPSHAALPGLLPVRPRHPRLAGDRARHGQAAGRGHELAGIRLPAHGRRQPVSRGRWAASARRRAKTAATATRSTISSASTRSSNMSATGRSRTRSPCPPPAAARRQAASRSIGGGPAGLSAAYFLRRKGHAVTIFDAHDKLGGMMRFGIPGYRTPRDMLDAEIGRITALDGVDGAHRRAHRQGRDDRRPRTRDFDAVFWAIGAQKGRPLPVPGADAANCITGIEFLDAFNRGWVFSTAKRSWSSAAATPRSTSPRWRAASATSPRRTSRRAADAETFGYTAHDVAGALRREGVHAVLTSLFPIEKMTAAEREREDAKREGIDIQGGVMPLEVLKDEKAGAGAAHVQVHDEGHGRRSRSTAPNSRSNAT